MPNVTTKPPRRKPREIKNVNVTIDINDLIRFSEGKKRQEVIERLLRYLEGQIVLKVGMKTKTKRKTTDKAQD